MNIKACTGFYLILSIISIAFLLLIACGDKPEPPTNPDTSSSGIELIVLGTVQDAGSPHIDCQKSCCASLRKSPDPTRKVVSLGIIDHLAQKKYLIEASPDITAQLTILRKSATFSDSDIPDAVFITHAHIGHYTGLMYFGREAKGAQSVPIYVHKRMAGFLKTNGTPWSQLIDLDNIQLRAMVPGKAIALDNILVQSMLVPHRDEYSETACFIIKGPNKKVLFIPDIDKWERWSVDINEIIS